MTKLDLQKELLEKIKQGVKPSDLKQSRNNKIPTPASTPPASPIITPIDKKTSQKHESKSFLPPPIEIIPKRATDSHKSPLKNQDKTLIKQLQDQVNFHAQMAQTHLANLQATMAKLDAAELNIKDLTQQNKSLRENISQLEKRAKITAEIKPEETKTFTCSDCQQNQPQSELSRQFANFSFCRTCSLKARQQAQQEKITPEPQDFICHTCQQTRQEIPAKMKLDSTLQEYSVCSTCRPNLKEFNEADLITDELWAKYPYSSASEILEKEFGIVKEEKW